MKRALLFVLLVAAPLSAQDLITGVQDNSFLLEEAYNQDPGVVQHINLFTRDRDAHSWAYGFTQEWPVGSIKHQLSYTIPVSDSNLGDVAINYRYQLVGDGESKLAIAPRLTVILPTGEDSDATGVQAGIPISRVLGSRVIAHTNLGATWFNHGIDAQYFAGQSVVFAISPRVNALVEALWTGSSGDDELVISPGIRWAYNFKSGLQVVPGIAYVMGDDNDAVLLYLSFEHPFRKQ